MQKFTFVLVVAALVVAGWQAYEAASLRDALESQQQDHEALRADLTQVTKRLAGLDGLEAPAAPILLPSGGTNGQSAAATTPTLAARAASPAVMARALQDLEAKVEDLETENQALNERVGNTPQVAFRRPKFIRDIASAKNALDLTSGQQADIERTVEWTKRELEDLYAIPSEDGKLYADVAKTKVQGGEGIQIVMPDFGAIQAFKNAPVPGRTETYAEAEQRIKQRGKTEVRDTLTPTQQETWDDSITDPLFGGTSNSFVSMVSMSTTDSEDD